MYNIEGITLGYIFYVILLAPACPLKAVLTLLFMPLAPLRVQ